MKILRIIARLNVGGPARHVVWLSKELAVGEFQTTLIAGTVPEGEDDMAYFAAENGVVPIYIKELSRELSPKDIVSLFKIYREIQLQKPNIIHTHTAKAGTVGRMAAFLYRWLTPGTIIGRPRKVKIVHTFHGHVFHSYYGRLRTRLFILIERLWARVATDRIVVISRQQLDEICRDFRIGRRDKFAVIPLGIDLDEYLGGAARRARLRGEIGAADDEVVVGAIGRLTGIKNIEMLLAVASLYRSKSDPDLPGLKFVIIGDGDRRMELEAQATQLGIDDLVTFLGNRRDVADLMPGLDIVALTSKNEGTPLSLIEAMAAGRPVISTAVGGVVDLLGGTVEDADGVRVCERGIAIPPGDSELFLNGLIYLVKNEKLRSRSAENGRRFVTANYSTKRLVDDIKSLYRELISD